jgi:hypothetical protein
MLRNREKFEEDDSFASEEESFESTVLDGEDRGITDGRIAYLRASGAG